MGSNGRSVLGIEVKGDLVEGDRNTGFFHRTANSHMRWNHITKMKINEAWVSEEAEMRQGIVEAF